MRPVSYLPGSQGQQPPAGAGGNGMEARIAKLESDVAHIQADISEIKADVREMRGTISGIKDSISSAKVWALFLYIGLAAVILGVLARGFKWL